MKKRIMWIDVARAIAMLCVIIGHSLYQYTDSTFGNMIYNFHMPLFFIFSGYLYHMKHWDKEARGAGLNLLLPYYTTAGLMGLVFLYREFFPKFLAVGFPPSAKALLNMTLYGVGVTPRTPFPTTVLAIGAIWFLMALAIADMVFNLVMIKTQGSPSQNISRLLIFGTLAGVGRLISTYWLLPLSINSALFALVFMYIGYLAKDGALLERQSGKLFIMALLIWLAVSTQQTFYLVSLETPDTLLAIVGAVAGTFAVVKLAQGLTHLKLTSRVMAFLGRNSIIILCFHSIDIMFSNVPNLIMTAGFTTNDYLKIVLVVLYRMIIPIIAAIVIPHIPVLRSLFLNRVYPFKKRGRVNKNAKT
ncbi:acyltransferase family protein [Levilactobacillus fujinensis]|uniref:Acyltransferase family protein n=1 Tax=Levilactobacillus fujinensis TaxID=2486024 RepID=A0ABW1TII4_9LACO|nr:acyltransferase family protein [Levilactobacillus fujinensis]